VAEVAVLDLHLMKGALRVLLLLFVEVGLGACRAVPAPEAPQPSAAPDGGVAPVSCRPERRDPIKVGAGRLRHCVIDVGSRNVKLVVASMEDEDPRSIKSERLCRSRRQLGEKTFDQKAQAARPLSPADQQVLAKLLTDYAALCKQDGGELAGAIATEWARRASNGKEIVETMKASGVDLHILSREDEARYGYLAATRGAPGKLVLDFGSRSLQLSYWPRGSAAPATASIPLGIDEIGDRFFGKKETFRKYGPARDAFVTALRSELAPHIAAIRRAFRASTLSPQLFSLAENGDVPLALDGKLWTGAKGVDEATYSALVKARPATPTAEYGPVTVVLPPKELATFAKKVESDPKLFEELRSDRTKRIYGYKMLAFPALVAALAEDLKLEEVVLVPQEMPEGLLVSKLREGKAEK
jgi:hypothetical protein